MMIVLTSFSLTVCAFKVNQVARDTMAWPATAPIFLKAFLYMHYCSTCDCTHELILHAGIQSNTEIEKHI